MIAIIARWLPAYLWYSGVLLQCLLVLLGLQGLFGLIERRPAHALEREVAKQLADEAQCTLILAGQQFSWLQPQRIAFSKITTRASLTNLVYRNGGTQAITARGNHIYRVWFETEIKELNGGSLIRFPSRGEQHLEVDGKNRIVRCVDGPSSRFSEATNLQVKVHKECEKKGWQRPLLCDRGTDRCYPMGQCSQAKAEAS